MSNVTEILSGRINLKRLTSSLLDLVAVGQTISTIDRQPSQTVRLEVSIVGNTVLANGLVSVFNNISSAVSQYVVTDRVLGSKWAIKVTDGVINLTSSGAAASSEPIVEDTLLAGIHWKIFVSDGVIGVESTSTQQDDEVILIDTSTSTNFQIVVSDGVLGLTVQTGGATTVEQFTFSENGTKFGRSDFSAVDGLTIFGISSGFIQVRAISKMSQPVNQLISVGSSVPVRFFVEKGRIRMKKPGQERVYDHKIMTEPDLDIQEQDLIYPISGVIGLTIGQVVFLEKIYDFDGDAHHQEAEIMRL